MNGIKTTKRNRLGLPQLESYLIVQQHLKKNSVPFSAEILDLYKKDSNRISQDTDLATEEQTNFEKILNSEDPSALNVLFSPFSKLYSLHIYLSSKGGYKRNRNLEESSRRHNLKVNNCTFFVNLLT